MNKRWYKPARANPGVKLLVVVVALIIVAWWVYMLKIRNHRPAEVSSSQNPQVVSLLPVDPDGPDVKFPDSARCDNKEVNDFIITFLNSLLSDDYKSYRLKVTQQREPINQKTFDEAYGRVKMIEVKKIVRVDDPKMLREMKIDDVKPPVYQIQADVTFRESQIPGREESHNMTVREVMLTIFKEGDRWVSSH